MSQRSAPQPSPVQPRPSSITPRTLGGHSLPHPSMAASPCALRTLSANMPTQPRLRPWQRRGERSGHTSFPSPVPLSLTSIQTSIRYLPSICTESQRYINLSRAATRLSSLLEHIENCNRSDPRCRPPRRGNLVLLGEAWNPGRARRGLAPLSIRMVYDDMMMMMTAWCCPKTFVCQALICSIMFERWSW